MADFIAFKCSLCSCEAASLEFLEGHIWNRHLGTFQYNCGECSYPALNYQALAAHFESKHQLCQEISFKRKISDEIKLREIVAASITVPVYDDEEHIYDEENGQVPDVIESTQNSNILTEEIPMEMEAIENPEQIIQGVDQNGQVIYVSKQDYPAEDLQLLESEAGTSMMTNQNGEVVAIADDNGDLVDCDEENPYTLYSGHDLLDDGYQYVDEEGNTVYVTDQYPQTSKGPRQMNIRAMKHRHINLIIDKVSRSSVKKRATTIWTCPDCGKTIMYPSRIEAHRRMHQGEKPYTCQECGNKFAQKGALKCHMRSHSGEKPYACTWDCGKSFVSASAQRMHEKLHSGERNYGCRVCGKLFVKKSHLIRHEEGVHHIQSVEHVQILPMGLDIAGSSTELLKNIVNGVVEEVQKERELKATIKQER